MTTADLNTQDVKAGFMSRRVVHLHPSRFCNFSCRHCYSNSGPQHRHELPLDQIFEALHILKQENYDVLSLSGGEPLLYSRSQELIRYAADLGFQVNLITNGTTISKRTLRPIEDYLGTVAVSLDGAPNTHTRFRNNPKAFLNFERALECLASRGLNFGISYCVSKESIEDMPWAVDFGQTKQAHSIQFHALGHAGRGRALADLCLSGAEKSRAYFIASLLDNPGYPSIQIDLLLTEAAKQRSNDYAILNTEDATHDALADLINPIVINDVGQVVPFSYGFSSNYQIGRIDTDFSHAITRYKEAEWKNLQEFMSQAFLQLESMEDNFIDWFQYLVDQSYRINCRTGEAVLAG